MEVHSGYKYSSQAAYAVGNNLYVPRSLTLNPAAGAALAFGFGCFSSGCSSGPGARFLDV